MRDVGIYDGFIRKARESVTPGTPVLFLLSSGAVEDRVRQRFTGTHAELLFTDLGAGEEARLREVFAVE